MEYQKDVTNPEEFFDGIKVDLFPDEVYVFTPKGDVRVFPRGSTPIDFAYAIHSEIGDHCTGARINGSIVPLRDINGILILDRGRKVFAGSSGTPSGTP
jgi:GTP pyrophosphokinase